MSENNTDQADDPKENIEVADNGSAQVEGLVNGMELNQDELAQGDGASEQDKTKEVETKDEKQNLEGATEGATNEAEIEEALSEEDVEDLEVKSDGSEDTGDDTKEELSIAGDKTSDEKTDIEVENSEQKTNIASVDGLMSSIPQIDADYLSQALGGIVESFQDSASSSQDAVGDELELISSNLKGIEKEISALQNPTDQQIDKAKKLILALSGLTGIVLIASITFFIVMSVSIAQKVDELDRVLMAVAKRGIQLADGIETISGMESKLKQVMNQNEKVMPALSAIEMKMTSTEEQINDNAERTRLAMQTQGSSILKSQDYLKSNLEDEVVGLKELIRRSVKLKPLEQEHSVLKRQLEKIDSSMTNVEARVQDLYVIKQAEIETAYKGLSSSE